MIDPLIPARMRERATRRAEQWMLERLNGEDGLGAIFPAMVNALEAMVILGYAADDPRRVTGKARPAEAAGRRPVERLLPALRFAGLGYRARRVSRCRRSAMSRRATASTRALDWLQTEQLLDEPGDWRVRSPGTGRRRLGISIRECYYPDLDDTAVVAWAMHQARDSDRYAESVRRALDWLVGMQSRDGGFAAFDADNTCYYLNKIPFADHGALLDPPTSDVTARVVTVLARIGRPQDKPALDRAIAYLREQQEADGSWFGRWGTNYIYGTWSVLMAFAQARIGAG